jgi:hypothetical protein
LFGNSKSPDPVEPSFDCNAEILFADESLEESVDSEAEEELLFCLSIGLARIIGFFIVIAPRAHESM